MTIKDYLKKMKMSDLEFAEKLGIHRTDVWRYRTGLRKPRPDLAKKIVIFTDKIVTLEDIYQ